MEINISPEFTRMIQDIQDAFREIGRVSDPGNTPHPVHFDRLAYTGQCRGNAGHAIHHGLDLDQPKGFGTAI